MPHVNRCPPQACIHAHMYVQLYVYKHTWKHACTYLVLYTYKHNTHMHTHQSIYFKQELCEEERQKGP